jgi:hypothetical protein
MGVIGVVSVKSGPDARRSFSVPIRGDTDGRLVCDSTTHPGDLASAAHPWGSCVALSEGGELFTG